jgi:hypothetical protein
MTKERRKETGEGENSPFYRGAEKRSTGLKLLDTTELGLPSTQGGWTSKRAPSSLREVLREELHAVLTRHILKALSTNQRVLQRTKIWKSFYSN